MAESQASCRGRQGDGGVGQAEVITHVLPIVRDGPHYVLPVHRLVKTAPQ